MDVMKLNQVFLRLSIFSSSKLRYIIKKRLPWLVIIKKNNKFVYLINRKLKFNAIEDQKVTDIKKNLIFKKNQYHFLNQMIKLTIIIPYKNSDKSIIKTLRSIKSQKVNDNCYEVSLINDFSRQDYSNY